MDGTIAFAMQRRQKNEKSVICKIGIIFTDFEEDLSKITFGEDFLYNYNIKLSKIMFDEEFLYNYNTKLSYHLLELFNENKCALCCFLDSDYHHKGRDWSTGYIWDVSLSEFMKYEKDLKKL